MRVRDWAGYYRKRLLQEKRLVPLSEPQLIEDCEFSFRCPMYAEFLTPSGSGDLNCSACNRKVYAVRTQAELEERSRHGDCVWFRAEDTAPALRERLASSFPVRCCLLGADGCGKSFLALSLVEHARRKRKSVRPTTRTQIQLDDHADALGRPTSVSVSRAPATEAWLQMPMQGRAEPSKSDKQGAPRRVYDTALVRLELEEARTVEDFKRLSAERHFSFVMVCYSVLDRDSFQFAVRELLPAAMRHAGRRGGVALVALRCGSRPNGMAEIGEGLRWFAGARTTVSRREGLAAAQQFRDGWGAEDGEEVDCRPRREAPQRQPLLEIQQHLLDPPTEEPHKLVLVGDFGVGKTSLMLRFVDDVFHELHIPANVGSDFRMRMLEVDNVNCRVQVWDTAGQERFQSLTSALLRNASGIIMCYDVTNRDSFEHVRRWERSIRRGAPDGVMVMLVGCKSDLVDERAVSPEEGIALALEIETQGLELKLSSLRPLPLFAETSSLTVLNVEEAFRTMVRRLRAAVVAGDVQEPRSTCVLSSPITIPTSSRVAAPTLYEFRGGRSDAPEEAFDLFCHALAPILPQHIQRRAGGCC